MGTGPLKTATYFNCIVGRGEEFLAGMEMEGNGAERLVRCILRYLGRGEGRSHCFYYCLWKGEEGTASPPPFLPLHDSIHERRGGDHEPNSIHPRIRRRSDNFSAPISSLLFLSYGHGVCVCVSVYLDQMERTMQGNEGQ